ncbi:hypothetical protein HA402_015182 [Bradysia odoriphaga]|nr:hypothetical protein HA402_015182 [Bradysia odoriphaga]
MNFAKNLLGKYGWKEGDGLGRDKHGITKPLKANYKFDNAGLGHNPADDLNNHWWENVYNQAATNLNVDKNEANEVKMGLNTNQSVEITTRNYSVKSNQKNADYGGSFLKSATLTNEGQEVEFAHKRVISPVIMKIVSDEELFKACGGRTAHKGARHGLKLSGKLNRIEKQEQELVEKLRSSTLEDSSQVFKDYANSKSRQNKKKLKRLNEKKSKKSRKSSNKSETITAADDSPVPCTTDTVDLNERQEDGNVKNSKKSKKGSSDEPQSSRKKSRKNKLSIEKPDKRSKRKHKKKLKQLSKEMRVPDSREEFLKKMAIEELSISFESTKMSKKNRRNSDLDSLHSYRCNDDESQSDDDNQVEQNISSQLSKKLSKIKNKKQKVIVEDLTEFQIEHLRNAQVPFVEVKQCSRSKQRKNNAKFNKLADNLVNKMSIL